MIMGFFLSCLSGKMDALTCVEHSDCREAFGFGSACLSDGDEKTCKDIDSEPTGCSFFPESQKWEESRSSPGWTQPIGAILQDEASVAGFELAISELEEQTGETMFFQGIQCEGGIDSHLEYMETLGVKTIVQAGDLDDPASLFTNREESYLAINTGLTSSRLLESSDGDLSREEIQPYWSLVEGPFREAQLLGKMIGILYGETDLQLYGTQNGYVGNLLEDLATELGMTDLEIADTAPEDASGIAAIAYASNSVAEIDAFVQSLEEAGFTGNLYLTGTAARSENLGSRPFNIRGTRSTHPDLEHISTFPNIQSGIYSCDQSTSSTEGDREDCVAAVRSYDATWLSALSLLYSQPKDFFTTEVDPEELSLALTGLTSEDGTAISLRASPWSMSLQHHLGGASFNMDGASSTLQLDPSTNEAVLPVVGWMVQDGSVQTFDPCQDSGIDCD
jgi:hypothetical protein